MNIILASTSTLFGGKYLEYLKAEIISLYQNIDEIIFIPFARPGGISHDEYTSKAKSFFATLNIKVTGLHEFQDRKAGINQAKGFFTGGGNTFLLVKTLHELGLMEVLKANIETGKPYLGCSAGSNIGGINMKTTNDMPIVYPPSFKTLGFVPFNINPHYLDPDPNSKHMGETRETRIKEYHVYNDKVVVGLREGSYLKVKGTQISLGGDLSARIFEKGKEPYEVSTETDISFLMQ